MINKFWKDESGATAVEYGLIAALVSVASIVGMRMLGGEIGATFRYIQCQMSGLSIAECKEMGKNPVSEDVARQGDTFRQ